MRFKALFYRFLFAIAGFLLPLAVLAGAAPYVINAEPFRKQLIEDLRNWTGSHVELNGPVAVESFFSLSLNARDVEFFAFKGLPQLQTLKADEIVARIAWMDLFAGRLDFDKIKINRAQIHMRAFDREDALTAAKSLLAMSRDAQFDTFMVRDSVISFQGNSGNEAEQDHRLGSLTISLEPDSQDIELSASFFENEERTSVRARIRAGALREPGALLPLELSLENPQAKASFAGTAKIDGDWRALGNISLALQDPSRLAHWLDQPHFDNLHLPVSVSGKADITKNRVAFDEARFSIASQDATGEFDLVFDDGKPKLLGSIAFGAFDTAAFSRTDTSGKQYPTVDPGLLKHVLKDIGLDLRLSAESIRFPGIETGEAAFTVLGENGRFSTEIAHMAILNGGVFGHAELDVTGNEPRMNARLTLNNLDMSGLQSLADVSPWLSGSVDGNVAVSSSGSDIADWLGNAAISGKAFMPDGGQIRMDLARLASMQTGEEQQGWDGIDSTWSDFDGLRFAFAYKRGTLNLSNIALERPDGIVKADGRVDTGEHRLDLRINFASAAASGAASSVPQAGSATAVSIHGPWAAPVLRSVSKTNRAANDIRSLLRFSESAGRL